MVPISDYSRVGPNQLAAQEPYAIQGAPTRFGRLNLELPSHDEKWECRFTRPAGPTHGSVQLPAMLGDRGQLRRLAGARYRREGGTIRVDPAAREWTAEWS